MLENQTLDKTMVNLKNTLEKINTVIPQHSKIYFFDYPVYENIGDLLIWKGTENYFKKNSIKVIKRYSYQQALRKIESNQLNIPSDITIVCQGGGNFGDIYTVYQKLRMTLIKNFPCHKIVILPQTIFYNDHQIMRDEFTTMATHKYLHVLLRDFKSYNLAKKSIKNIYLLPDMAHQLYPISTKNKTSKGSLLFLRKDKERTNIDISNIGETFDWDQLLTNIEKRIIIKFQKAHSSRKVNLIIPNIIMAKLWGGFAQYLIKKAIKVFSKKQLIITSRLHGHILACLMNKENLILDNSYGKNINYYNAWTNKTSMANLYFHDEKQQIDRR